jgi:kynurenine formamidase
MYKQFLILGFFLFFSSTPAMAADGPNGRIIDLTHSFDEKTIYWPTEPGFKLQKENEGMTEKGYFYASNLFTAPEHGGTHIDAPHHFSEKGRTVDEIPLEQLIGTGIIVDVSAKCMKDRDYQITVDDFQEWEKQNGQISEGAIVLLRTGFGKYWPDRARYMGTDERGKEAVAKLHFPGLGIEAAKWLADERRIKAVGLDTPSIDYGQSTLFETHVALAERNIPNFENLANLSELPLKGFRVIALPMKIKGGSGGPVRIAAIIESEALEDL